MAGGLFACLAFSVNPASAESGQQYFIYDVYAGGIHAVQAQLTIDYTQNNRYAIELGAHTRGVLGKLAPWSGTFESEGWVISDDELRPELHRSISTWRGEKETKSYNYTKDGGFKNLIIKDHDKPEEQKDVPDEVTKDTTDAFTAALMVMESVHQGGKCEGRSEVFDGKRRFAQIFKEQERVKLKPSKYNVFGGDAVECTVEIEPISGEWSSKPRGWLSIQEQGRERGTMPTIWLGSLSEGGPAVPVKILVKTAYGSLFMHLSEYRDGENVVVAEKRKG